MKKIKKRIRILIYRLFLRIADESFIKGEILNDKEKVALGLIHSGYLRDIGWWTSFDNKESLTNENEPLPWVTYSFIYFIKERLKETFNVFEYGTGNSTLFYQNKVAFLHSVEHDLEWFNNLENKVNANVKLLFRSLGNPMEYERSVLEANLKYDIVIVDGRNRINCVKHAIQAVHEQGVIILDDSERVQYLDGKNALVQKGYKELEFWGISPGFISYNKCTSIFYKSDNVLGL